MVRSKSPFATKTFRKKKVHKTKPKKNSTAKNSSKMTLSQQRKKRFESICSPIGESSLLLLSMSGCALFDDSTSSSDIKGIRNNDKHEVEMNGTKQSGVENILPEFLEENENDEVSQTVLDDLKKSLSSPNINHDENELEQHSSKKKRRTSYEKSPAGCNNAAGFVVGYARRTLISPAPKHKAPDFSKRF